MSRLNRDASRRPRLSNVGLPRSASPLWRDKFRTAFRGIKRGVRGHSSFHVHFFFAAVVAVMATLLECTLVEWCILSGCVGLVIVAELFRSSLEAIVQGLDAETKPRCSSGLEIAAGAVLVATFLAVILGSFVFLRRWMTFFGVDLTK
ncbi:MAG: diacylglycerol kinase [Gemmataceae bacterium]